MKLTEGIAGLVYSRDKNITRSDRDYEEYREYKAKEAALELMKSRLQRENTAGQNSLLPSSARSSAQRRSSGYTPVTGSIVSRPGRSSLWSDPNELRNTLMAAAAERSRSEFDRASSKVTDLLAENTSRKEMERERDRLAVNPDRLSDAQISRLDELNRLLADTRDIGTRVADSRIDRDRAFAAMGSEEARAIQKKVLDAKVSGPSRGTSLLDNQQVRDSVSDWWGRTADKKKAAEDETAREQALSYDEVMSEIKKLDDEIANSGIQKKQNDLTVSSFGMDDDAVEKSKDLDSVNQEISELYQRRQHYKELAYQKKMDAELEKLNDDAWNKIYSLYGDLQGKNGEGSGWKSTGELYSILKESGADADSLLEYFLTDAGKQDIESRRESIAQFAKDYPVVASAGSVLASPLEAVGALSIAFQKGANMFRDDGDYRPVESPLSVSQTIRGTIGERLEHNLNESKIFGQDLESFLYQTGMSAADSAFTTAATMGLGSGLGLSGQALKSFASAATTGTISMGAVTTSFADAKARGLDDNQAFSLAVASGLIEAATEKFSVEALLKEPKSVIGYIAENILTEASEETVSEVAGKIADVIIAKDRSEWSTRIAELMESGMTEAEATSQAFGEAAQDVLASGLGGALSGGAMAGGGLAARAAIGAVNNRISTRNQTAQESIFAAAQERAKAEAAKTLSPTASPMELAQQAMEQSESVQEVLTAYDSAIQQSAEEAKPAIQQAFQETAREYGISADLFERKAPSDEAQTDTQRAVSPKADQDTVSDQSPRTEDTAQPQRQQEQTARPVSVRTEQYAKPAEEVQPEKKSVRLAQARITESGTRAVISGISSVTADNVMLETASGKTVALSDISFDDPDVQTFYNAAAQYDMRGANAFLRHYSGNVSLKTYQNGFNYFYNAGQSRITLPTAMKNLSVYVEWLGKDAVTAAYNTGANALAAERASAKAPAVTGIATGKFTDKTSTGNSVMKEIAPLVAEKFGVDIDLVDTLGGGNGNYLASRAKITIAADAENVYAALTHELGEHVKAYNREGWEGFASEIVNWWAKHEGIDSLDRLTKDYQSTYAAAEGSKTYTDAQDEMLFDALNGLFSTEDGIMDFLSYLKSESGLSVEEQKTVLQRLVDFIERIIGEIKELLKDSRISKAAQTTLQMEQKQAEAIRRELFQALEEASDNYRKEGKKKTASEGGEAVKYSLKTDSDGNYVHVDVDQDIFDGLSTKEMATKARDQILIRFRDKILPVGVESSAFINKRSAVEYAYPANRRMQEDLKKAKMRASTELDNLLAASRFLRHDEDDGRHADATGGWDVYQTRFEVGGEMFTGEVKIKLTNRGRTFYDMTKVKQIPRTSGPLEGTSNTTSGNLSDTTITSSDGNVNSQYMQKSAEDSGEVKHSFPTDETPSRKQLLRENEKLKQALETMREQFKLSKGHRLSDQAIKRIATRVIIDSNSMMKTAELTPKLRVLFDSIANGDPVWGDLVESARVIAGEVVEKSRNNTRLNEESQKTIMEIRSIPVSLSEEQKRETAYHYGSYGAFRKQNFGRLNISDQKGVPLESRWLELAEMYPSVFDTEVSELDMPVRLAEIVSALSEDYESEYGFTKDDAVADLTYRILDEYWNVPEVSTYADRNKKKIDALKAEQRKKVKELRQELKDKYNAALKDERAKLALRVKDVRDKKNDQLLRQKVKYLTQQSESRAKRLDTAERQRHRRYIIKRVKALDKLLRHETDQKHIPEGLKRQILELLMCFAEDTSVFSSKTLDGVQDAYRHIDENLLRFYDEDIYESLQNLKSAIDGKRLSQLTVSELKTVREVIDHFSFIVRTANEMFVNGKKVQITELGEETVKELDSHQRGELSRKAEDSKAASAFANLLNADLVKPVYFFKEVGGTMQKLYQDLRNGEGVWAKNIQAARKAFHGAEIKYRYKSWYQTKEPIEIQTEGGKTLKLSIGQALSLYVLSRRKQGMNHMLTGGITLRAAPDNKLDVKGNRTVKLTATDIENIIGELTDEQRGFAEEMQHYLSTVMAELGNEASMQLYGIRKFTEDNYFPIISESNYLYSQPGVTSDQRIKHTGFTNRTMPEANNPITIMDFSAVWANHVDRMCLYNAFVVPLENFNRVYNYQSIADGSRYSVKESLAEAYGKKAGKYIDHLIEDINGGVRHRSDGLASALISKFKKNAVFASASVVVQQPSAIGRAVALIGPEYFVTKPGGKAAYEEMKKYAPVAFIKELGRFDTNTGVQTTDYLTGVGYDSRLEKGKALVFDSKYRDDVLSRLPALADEVTWTHIWQAVKHETKAKHPDLAVGSEEYFQECGRRFTEVVDFTQVYDSVFSRSGLERNTDGLSKMISAFMAEPITSYNLLRDGVIQGKRGDLKYTARAFGAYALSVVMNSLLKAFVQAGRDDDDKYGYWEKYLGNVVGNLIDDPLSMIPYVKDIISLMDGYDTERLDMSLFSDLIEAFKSLQDENKDALDKIQAISGAVGAFFGIPVKNIWRDVEMYFRDFSGIFLGTDAGFNGRSLEYSILENLPKFLGVDIGTEGDRAYAALLDGDMDYYNRMIKGKTGDQVDNMLRKALKENEPRVLEGAKDWANADSKAYMEIVGTLKSELTSSYQKREGLSDETDARIAAQNDIVSSIVTLGDQLRKLRDAGQDITRFTSYDEAKKAIDRFNAGEKEEGAGGDTDDDGILKTKQVVYNLEAGDIDEAKFVINEIIESKSYDENGVFSVKLKDKARGSIKTGLTSHYKPLYQEADSNEKARIRRILTQTGLYFVGDINKWNKKS